MIRFLTFGFTVLMLVVSGMTYAQERNTNSFDMTRPDGVLAVSSFLGDGAAGISAYGQVSGPNLELAKNAFRNVEKDTDEYIIGSVALPDYEETDDVHVYVDISGWIVAYYCSTEEASKIIDWVDYHSAGEITGTKLSDAISIVTSAMSVTPPEDIKYFDFRYPDATEMMIVIDKEFVRGETETFNIKVPTSHLMYSKTWSHAIYDHDSSGAYPRGNIMIDNAILHNSSGIATATGWEICVGDIGQLSHGDFHEISLYHHSYYAEDASYVGIMFIYAEQQ